MTDAEQHPMARALDVARCLIQLAASGDEPDFLTHLRLQKLLYYVQGWSLALRNSPMFDDRIEALVNGPVARSVYRYFADYGFGLIMPTQAAEPEDLSEEDAEFIGSIWEAYKGYSASSLRSMTHKERPWRDARAGFRPDEKCENEITHEAMKAFFSALAEEGNG